MYNEHDQNQVKKIYRDRRRKKRKRRIRIFMLIIVVLGFWYYLSSDYSRITKIEISGNEQINQEEILKMSNIQSGIDKIIFLRSNQIEDLIHEITGIKDVNVKNHYNGKVTITVKEYETIAYFQENDQFFLINQNGEVIISQNTTNLHIDTLPKLENFNQKILESFAVEYAKLDEEVRGLISDITYNPKPSDEKRCEIILSTSLKLIVRYDDMVVQLKDDNLTKLINQNPNATSFDLNGKYCYITE